MNTKKNHRHALLLQTVLDGAKGQSGIERRAPRLATVAAYSALPVDGLTVAAYGALPVDGLGVGPLALAVTAQAPQPATVPTHEARKKVASLRVARSCCAARAGLSEGRG